MQLEVHLVVLGVRQVGTELQGYCSLAAGDVFAASRMLAVLAFLYPF